MKAQLQLMTVFDSDDPIHRLQAKDRFGSNATQSLASFALKMRDDIPSMSIGAFAHNASVSQTTVVRLCKELGYRGYRDFRIAMAESRGHRRGADLLGADVPATADPTTETRSIARQVIRINADILTDTYDILDVEAVERAMDLILKSSHVHLVGLGSSAPVVLDLQQRLLRLGLAASCYSDSHIIATISATARPGSMFFGISYSGTSRDVVECLETASARGHPTVALTSITASPLAQAADVILISAVRDMSIRAETISSRISQLAIIDILIVALTFRLPLSPDIAVLERELTKKRQSRDSS